MNNFEYCNPTRLVFGKGQIARIAKLIPKDARVMVTFGGGSVRRNGVYEAVRNALREHDYIEFWGIEPNPCVETLRKAIAKGLDKQIDFLLAVGGGSVLDGTKLIAAAIANPKVEPWDLVLRGKADQSIPFASVMTLPATGSEMNSGAVISCRETQEKRSFYSNYPQFSVLDPEVTYSLPPHQIACGLTDIFIHVLEQYLTRPGQSRPMDRWAEGLMLTILEIAPKIWHNSRDYDLMSDYMLTATLALNDMIRMGVDQDWSTHMIGHELTALCGIAHGASLAIVMPGTMEVLKEQKWGKLLQYAERVWKLTEGSEEERINKAIAETEAFFQSLGLATRLGDAGIPESTITAIVERFHERSAAYGENHNVDGEMARRILLSRK